MSMLSDVAETEVVNDPFPHVVVKNALHEDLCSQLMSEFPPLEVVTRGREPENNKRFSYGARYAIKDGNLSPVWREFICQQSSQRFLNDILRLFGNQLRQANPDFERQVGRMEELQAGVRDIDTYDHADVLLDTQICVNTPVIGQPSCVRGPHVDNRNKLFVGLLYLRPEQDDSQGGDLNIYRVGNNQDARYLVDATKKKRGQVVTTAYLDEDMVEPVSTVRYEKNTLILFLNGPFAIHGVTPRAPTPWPRMFVNFVGELQHPLFEIPNQPPAKSKTFVDRAKQLFIPRSWRRAG